MPCCTWKVQNSSNNLTRSAGSRLFEGQSCVNLNELGPKSSRSSTTAALHLGYHEFGYSTSPSNNVISLLCCCCMQNSHAACTLCDLEVLPKYWRSAQAHMGLAGLHGLLASHKSGCLFMWALDAPIDLHLEIVVAFLLPLLAHEFLCNPKACSGWYLNFKPNIFARPTSSRHGCNPLTLPYPPPHTTISSPV